MSGPQARTVLLCSWRKMPRQARPMGLWLENKAELGSNPSLQLGKNFDWIIVVLFCCCCFYHIYVCVYTRACTTYVEVRGHLQESVLSF